MSADLSRPGFLEPIESSMTSPINRIMLLLAISAQMFGCNCAFGYYDQDRATAERAVLKFHQLYNDRNYASIYALMAPQVQEGSTEASFSAAVEQTSKKYGAFKHADLAVVSCFPHQVRFIYLTEFEKGKATEMMIWAVNDHKAALTMYRISPGFVKTEPDPRTVCSKK